MEKDRFWEALERLYTVNIGIRVGERTLVFSDTIRPDEKVTNKDRDRRERLYKIARMAAEVGKIYGPTNFIEYPALDFHGQEPPKALWEAAFGREVTAELEMKGLLSRLLRKDASHEEIEAARSTVLNHCQECVHVIIGMANFSTSHTQFRKLATEAGARFISMPLFDPEMFFGPMDVDWTALAKRTEKLADLLGKASWAFLSAENMTHLTIGLEDRKAWADTGLLTAPGCFGNLPAGEAFIAPVEGTAEGTLAVKYGPTAKLKEPLLLKVRNGIVFKVEGKGEYARFLRTKLRESPANGNIAELGIGTNEKARDPFNILEAEKILGTIHIALGDNSGFGGMVRTPFHIDHVVFNSTLELKYMDGRREEVIREGRLLVGMERP